MKLSIITINLNNASGLRKTIESVVSQKFSDFEYLIIDGGSTDGSVEVIKEYNDKITFWVSETDEGIYSAMNKGILKATGVYCLFLNSGDWLVDNILESVFTINFNEDIFYGNIILEFKDKPQIVDCACGKFNLTFYDFYMGTIRHQAAFIKRNLFDKFGLYDESNCIVSDWQFFVKTIIFGNATYKYQNITISHFDANGIGTKPSIKHNKERQKILRSFLPDKVLQDYKKYDELIQHNFTISKELQRYKHRFENIDKFISKLKKTFYSIIIHI
jgi:glycosyltransferase involved in cell wall biosynthesis